MSFRIQRYMVCTHPNLCLVEIAIKYDLTNLMLPTLGCQRKMSGPQERSFLSDLGAEAQSFIEHWSTEQHGNHLLPTF